MIRVEESRRYDLLPGHPDGYGREHMCPISKRTAAALCGMYPLPDMGSETAVALNNTDLCKPRLYVANISGKYYLRCSHYRAQYWPEIFGVAVRRV